MSGAPSLPNFEPPPSLLSSLSTAIQTSLRDYEAASNPADKAAALQKIQLHSTKLSRATAPIPQQFLELNMRPYLNVALRIAIEMNLFSSLPISGTAISPSDLAQKITNTDEEFVLRISRVLAAFDILSESPGPLYSHTPFSRFLLNPTGKASIRHLFDIMLRAHMNSTIGYWKQNGFSNPEDAGNCPFTFAHGKSDMNVFDIMELVPEQQAVFNEHMATVNAAGIQQLVQLFDFGKLLPNKEGVVLVDVGGGKGHVINEIRSVYPEMKGFMLQDMKVVLDGSVLVDDEVELIPYDFFNNVQPVKGSNYFLKAVLHDWPDAACLTILSNLAPAMKGHPSSRLLISDLVLPDSNPSPSAVLRDMNMLLIGGKERNVAQWDKLLSDGGFKILEIHGLRHSHASIIEAVLDE
ncbi:S-adenosyl-L-methionine-dependent methyltransferase [Stipitochalara longipes BDJ]|nr:S-adenosyl-L-methionine-dependent methyltransferase [Stipitochalara longipes BDJ]